MARVLTSDRALSINQVAGQKRFGTVRNSQAAVGAQDRDAILRIRWNPDWSESQTDGTAMTAATVDADATNIVLADQVGTERSIAHAGLTVRQMVDEINVKASSRRPWRAGFADVDPNVAVTPATIGAAISAEIGYEGDSVPLNHSTTGVLWISPGFDGSGRGTGHDFPDAFDTDYDYPVTTAGRGGGISANLGEDILPGKASRFGTGQTQLAAERYPTRPVFETVITSFSHSLTTVGAENLVVEVYEDTGPGGASTPIWGIEIPEATAEQTVPNVRTSGAAYVKVSSKSAGAFTAGSFAMRGFIRMA